MSWRLYVVFSVWYCYLTLKFISLNIVLVMYMYGTCTWILWISYFLRIAKCLILQFNRIASNCNNISSLTQHPIFIMRPKNKSKILEFVRCTSHDFNKDNNTLLLNRNLQYRNVSWNPYYLLYMHIIFHSWREIYSK